MIALMICAHVWYVSRRGSLGTLLAIVLADTIIMVGLMMRKEAAWYLAILGAIHLALRKPFYDYAFVLPFGAAYIISATLIFCLWISRSEFNVRGWRWLNAVVSFGLASCVLLVGGYYFPQTNIDYTDPIPPLLVQIVDRTGLGPGELLLSVYAGGVIWFGIVTASRWVQTQWSIRQHMAQK